jgi:predicted phosphodiesterase
MKDIQLQIESLRDQPLKDNLDRVIEKASTPLTENDYPDLMKEFKAYYMSQLSKQVFPALIRINVSDNLPAGDGINENARRRVVIIGDLHSDLTSFCSILKTLALSSYDYFSNAFFIFCGDYTDRGRRPIETLRLLYAFKTYLGERCILLKGNHEIIRYSCNILRPGFAPADTPELMNRVFSPEVNNLYSSYLDRLPYIVSLYHSGKRYIVCHGGIPRHDYSQVYNEDKFREYLLPANGHSGESIMLSQILWGDPGDASSSFRGTEIRFEFSKAEFLEFMDRHGYDVLIRGHQPVDNGVMYCYNNRLISLFSSGGHNNPDTYYPDDVAIPAFVIINDEGEIQFEKVF